MRKEDRKPSKRVFPLLQNLDLDSVTFSQVQGVGDSITIEDMNEQELQDLVLVNLARLVVSGEWTGLLEAGGGSSYNSLALVDMSKVKPTTGSIYQLVGSPLALGSASTFDISTSTVYDASFYIPFISTFGAVIHELEFNVQTASTSANLIVGIYSEASGLPNALLGSKETVDVTSTGDKTISTPFGGSLELEEGTQYFLAFVRSVSEDQVVLKATDNQASGWMPTKTTAQMGRNIGRFDADDLDLPDTLTFGVDEFTGQSKALPIFLIRWDHD